LEEFNVIKMQLTPHRVHLRASLAESNKTQKLFLLAQFTPEISTHAPLALTFVIDTSGSMREKVAGGKTKLELVIQALSSLLASDSISTSDQLAIVQFDDNASTLVPLTNDRAVLQQGLDTLKKYSGVTMMGLGAMMGFGMLGFGMLEALKQSSGGRSKFNHRLMLVVGSATFDEDVCRAVAGTYANQNIAINSIGVGYEFNEELLSDISDRTAGRVMHVVAKDANPPASVLAADLPQYLSADFSRAAAAAITNLELTVRGAKGVTLDRVTRVYPFLTDVMLNRFEGGTYAKGGDLEAGDQAIFLIELTLPPHPPAHVSIAQIGLTFDVPGEDRRGEIPPIDVVVEFTFDEVATGQVNQQVMGYVRQRNFTPHS
jgi:Ca-activated chloride channel homolog